MHEDVRKYEQENKDLDAGQRSLRSFRNGHYDRNDLKNVEFLKMQE